MTHFSQRQFQECPPNLCIYQTSILLDYWTSLPSFTLESSIFQRFDFLCVHIVFLIQLGYGCRSDFIQSQAWGTETPPDKNLGLDHFPEKTVTVTGCTWGILVSIFSFFKKEKDHWICCCEKAVKRKRKKPSSSAISHLGWYCGKTWDQ